MTKGEGVKNLQKLMTSFMNGPKLQFRVHPWGALDPFREHVLGRDFGDMTRHVIVEVVSRTTFPVLGSKGHLDPICLISDKNKSHFIKLSVL